MKIAMLGIGEAGRTIAADLIAAGVIVSGWDPEPKQIPPGVIFATGNAEAAQQADLILSINLAAAATDVAYNVLPILTPQQLFAEINTASPQTKRRVADILQPSGALVADAALMAPVPLRGLKTSVLVSGPGAQRFHTLMTPLGMPVTVLDEQVGTAATRKLIRSIAYKGIAAVVVECLAAAEPLGLEDYARQQLLTLLPNEAMIDRFVEGSRTHAVRRSREMEAVAALLEEIGVPSYTTTAALEQLKALSALPNETTSDLE
ncbi:MAG: NAD(P)-dependent oxidoreductase [Anaerolineae bacterium]|nr:NAD(P)-dependent oxidoreductase [Anaerolineae bacterium]